MEATRRVVLAAAIVESQVQDAARAAGTDKRGSGIVVRRADLGLTTLANVAPADRGPSPRQVAGHGELDARLERALFHKALAELRQRLELPRDDRVE
ncbi:MAG: hypothetical protein MUC36_28230 [Planctomycetes bacterium]|nr:hypothetical protein [Planctomycetota bacterium]